MMSERTDYKTLPCPNSFEGCSTRVDLAASQSVNRIEAQEVYREPSILCNFASTAPNNNSFDDDGVSNFSLSGIAEENGPDNTSIVSPLRDWVSSETFDPSPPSSLESQYNTRCGTLRKLTVGFGIGKLLVHLQDSVRSYTQDELLRLCSVDNITVSSHVDFSSEGGWEICGVNMVSPPMSLQLRSSDLDSSCLFSSCNDKFCMGRDVETAIVRHSPFCCANKLPVPDSSNNKYMCCTFGVILRFIFSGECMEDNSSVLSSNPQEETGCVGDFLRSLSISPEKLNLSLSISPENINLGSNKRRASLQKEHYTYYHVISRLVNDLLDCQQDECPTLESVVGDMHRLLLDPNRFLFESNHHLANTTKMYGRSTEAKAVLDAFCRVASSRQSEAFMIKGYSGSGKTRLVQSVSGTVHAANGLLVSKKFEEGSNNQLAFALSSFDDLCIILAESLTVDEGGTAYLWHELVSQFGMNLHLLVSTLPSVVRLAPSPATTFSLMACAASSGTDVNFFSLCYIIKIFMRAVATTSRTVMIFWDDLQWCDSVSLGLMHTVLSDNIGANCCLFFVGSYRDNEVTGDHILQGFFAWLSTFNVPMNSVFLASLSDEDVMQLVSDSLGMLPHLCGSLAQVVYRKTKGNPFFVQTFLYSLVDKHLLTYNLRKKSWVWNMDEICAENVTPNVLDLLSNKLTNMSEDCQNALKVAACFGIEIRIALARNLSSTQQYSTLLGSLSDAVEDGLMDLTSGTNGSSYRFVHDKVREASYSMISEDERDQFHFNIGMALLDSETGQKSDDILCILDQVNFGVPSLLSNDTQRMLIAKLNYNAASKMMAGSNYTSAYQLAKAALTLLPDDSSTICSNLSLKCYFLLSKAAHSYSKIDEAKNALNKVIEHADSLQMKLDAYALQLDIIHGTIDQDGMSRLLVAMVGVLQMLGEHLPYENLSEAENLKYMHLAAASYDSKSEDDLARIHGQTPENFNAIMQAYSTLLAFVPFAKPSLYAYFSSKWAIYYLKHQAESIYSPGVYIHSAVSMCNDMNGKFIQLGRKVGRIGLSILHQTSHVGELPLMYLLYYGRVGILFEPVQACIERQQHAYDTAQLLGNNSLASLLKLYLIARRLHAGVNLIELRDEMEHAIKTTEYNDSFPLLTKKARFYHKTVSILIGDEPLHGESEKSGVGMLGQDNSYYVSHMILMVYLGFYERAKHTASCWENASGVKLLNSAANFCTVYVYFFWGIALIGHKRKKNGKAYRLPENAQTCIDAVKKAFERSPWNWKNKFYLLQAEKFSYNSNFIRANYHYDVAIAASKESHFIHEEGLACELAGNHYERLSNTARALALFRQAEQCYECWGSLVKTRQMADKISKLS